MRPPPRRRRHALGANGRVDGRRPHRRRHLHAPAREGAHDGDGTHRRRRHVGGTTTLRTVAAAPTCCSCCCGVAPRSDGCRARGQGRRLVGQEGRGANGCFGAGRDDGERGHRRGRRVGGRGSGSCSCLGAGRGGFAARVGGEDAQGGEGRRGGACSGRGGLRWTGEVVSRVCGKGGGVGGCFLSCVEGGTGSANAEGNVPS